MHGLCLTILFLHIFSVTLSFEANEFLVYLVMQSVVNFLGKLSHPSLVKLLGYCWEENDLLLVYEFMPRGSLENYIFRSTKSMMKTGN